MDLPFRKPNCIFDSPLLPSCSFSICWRLPAPCIHAVSMQPYSSIRRWITRWLTRLQLSSIGRGNSAIRHHQLLWRGGVISSYIPYSDQHAQCLNGGNSSASDCTFRYGAEVGSAILVGGSSQALRRSRTGTAQRTTRSRFRRWIKPAPIATKTKGPLRHLCWSDDMICETTLLTIPYSFVLI